MSFTFIHILNKFILTSCEDPDGSMSPKMGCQAYKVKVQ